MQGLHWVHDIAPSGLREIFLKGRHWAFLYDEFWGYSRVWPVYPVKDQVVSG